MREITDFLLKKGDSWLQYATRLNILNEMSWLQLKHVSG